MRSKPSSQSGQRPAATDPIASALRRLHDDVVAEPLPDDFLKLLAEIDTKIADRKSGS